MPDVINIRDVKERIHHREKSRIGEHVSDALCDLIYDDQIDRMTVLCSTFEVLMDALSVSDFSEEEKKHFRARVNVAMAVMD